MRHRRGGVAVARSAAARSPARAPLLPAPRGGAPAQRRSGALLFDGLRVNGGLLAALLLLGVAGGQARAETASAAAPEPETPSYLELAERLRSVGSFSECAVEALRYAYDHPADRARGFERAALCLSLAGRYDDARRLMLALPSEGAALDGPGRLRICLSEVFLLELGAPACPSLESGAPPDRFHALGLETLRMRTIRARH